MRFPILPDTGPEPDDNSTLRYDRATKRWVDGPVVDPTSVAAMQTTLDDYQAGVDATDIAVNNIVRPQTYSGTAVDIFLIYGQSNAKGYAANTPGDPTYKTPKVRVWDGATTIPLTNYMPSQNDNVSTGGAWVAFANEYARQTGRTAILANCARGSQSIAELAKGAANTNYSGLVTWANNIKTHITGQGGTVGKVVVLFCQGERDSLNATGATTYTTALSTLWTDLKADVGANLLALYTVGFYNGDPSKLHGQVIQAAQRRFAADTADVIVAFDDIESLGAHGMKTDAVHLNQRGYNIMGEKSAAPIVSTLFTDVAPAQAPALERQGRINLEGTQEWVMYGGWLNGPGFQPSVTTNRATSGIAAVSVQSDHLAITLADRIDYVLSATAEFKSAGVAGTWLKPVFQNTIHSNVDADGRTVLQLYFLADVTARIRQVQQTIDTALMGVDLSGLFSVTWGANVAVISHPATKHLVRAWSREPAVPHIVSSVTTDFTTTQVRGFDLAGAVSKAEIAADFRSLKIPPAMLTMSPTELTFSVIGARKRMS